MKRLKAWIGSWSVRNIPRHGGRPYLERHGREQTLEDARRDRVTGKKRVRLHHFVGPDDAGHHNHPFLWSFSIVISVLWGGSYTEEVMYLIPNGYDWAGEAGKSDLIEVFKTRIETRRVRFFNWIPNGKYHRITQLHPGLFGVWTLFVTGPRVTSWGFWDPPRGHIPHKQYNAEHERGDEGRES